MTKHLDNAYLFQIRNLLQKKKEFPMAAGVKTIGGIVHHSATNRPSLRVRGFCLDGTCSMNFLERFICLTLAM